MQGPMLSRRQQATRTNRKRRDWGDLAGVGERGELTKDVKCTWESL